MLVPSCYTVCSGAGSTQQSVARAKDQIKRFRRRTSTVSSTPSRQTQDTDLPPPYSENPPLNPFYTEEQADLDHSAIDDSRPLVVSPPAHPSHQHAPQDPFYHAHLYPLLHPIVPPYQGVPAGDPPPFTPTSHPFLHRPEARPHTPGGRREDTTSHPFLRREDSYLSDGEAADAAAGLANLHLRGPR